jgi:cell division protein FtsZ
MAKFDKGIEVIWGYGKDEKLKEEVKVTILAIGFGRDSIPMMIEMLGEEDEAEKNKDIDLIDEYYGKGTAKTLGKTTKPKPFIFKSIEQMADDEIIEALIAHPAYSRSSKIMLDIAQKAEARRQPEVSEQEN